MFQNQRKKKNNKMGSFGGMNKATLIIDRIDQNRSKISPSKSDIKQLKIINQIKMICLILEISIIYKDNFAKSASGNKI